MKLRRPKTKDYIRFFILAALVQAVVILISKLQGAWVADGRILIGIYVMLVPVAWDTLALSIEDANKYWE